MTDQRPIPRLAARVSGSPSEYLWSPLVRVFVEAVERAVRRRCPIWGHVWTAPRCKGNSDPQRSVRVELMPSRNADDNELLGIGSALGVTGTGAFGMNSDFDDEEFELHCGVRAARS